MKATKVNFRPPLLLAAAVTAGVLAAGGMFSDDVLLLLGGVLAFILEIILAFVLFPRYRYFVLPLLFIFTIAWISAFYQLNSWEQQPYFGEFSFRLTDEVRIEREGETDKIVAVGKDIEAGGKKLKGRVLAEIVMDRQSNLENISAGDIVKVYEGSLERAKLTKNKEFNSNYYKSDIRFFVTVHESDIRRTRANPDFITEIRIRVKDIFYRHTNPDTAAIGYAMITGDQGFIDSELYSVYAVSGLAHILSASGLHIGFLFAAIGALLGKIKGRRGLKFALTVPIVLFYTAICNFSVTIVRAAIMGLIAAAGSALGRRNDLLNNLMISEAVMLLVKPLYLFDLSFLLSFSAVLGIALVNPPLARAFSKMHFLKGEAGKILAMTISANIGVFPAATFYFNSFYIYGLLLNMLLIPLLNIVFIAMLVILLLALIIPALGVLIVVPGFVISAVNYIAQFITGLPFAAIIVFSAGFLWIFYFILMFFSGGLINTKSLTNKIAALTLAAIFIFCFIPYKVPDMVYAKALTAIGSYGGASTVIFNEQGKSMVVACLDSSAYRGIRDLLIRQRLRHVDCLVLLKPEEQNLKYAQIMVKEFSIKKVYVVTEDIDLADIFIKDLPANVTQVFGGIAQNFEGAEIFAFAHQKNIIGVTVNSCGQKILYPLTSSRAGVGMLSDFCGYADIIVSRNYLEGITGGVYIITWHGAGGQGNMTAFEQGNFTIKF